MHRNRTLNALLEVNAKPSSEAAVGNAFQTRPHTTILIDAKTRRRSHSFSNLTDIRNIDDEPDEDDEDEYEQQQEQQQTFNFNTNYDEKDELCNDVSLLRKYASPFEIDKNTKETNADVASVDMREDDLDNSEIYSFSERKKSIKSKSTFYPITDEMLRESSGVTGSHSETKSEVNLDDSLLKLFGSNEILIDKIDRVYCTYSSSMLNSDDLKHLTTDCIMICGRLMLTNFQLIFIANDDKRSRDDLKKVAEYDDQLYLFNAKQAFSFKIPLALIYEIRASNQKSLIKSKKSGESSKPSQEKYRRITQVLENSPGGIPRDMLIKCKNFMTKLFTFINPSINYQSLHKFVSNLIYNSNNQRILNDRFKSLIKRVTELKNNNKETRIKSDSSNASSSSLKTFSQTETNRKLYLTIDDLQHDLVECECDAYMKVTNGSATVFPGFLINTKMPFCVIPKNVKQIIKGHRVVINESSVQEFVLNEAAKSNQENSNNNQKKTSMNSIKISWHHRFSPSYPSSPKTPNYQAPALAPSSNSNPFYDNNFPIWSFTNAATGCSLIVVPEAVSSSRQEECAFIIKNYNAFLCDENVKCEKQASKGHVSIGSNNFSEYEYYRFQVPFEHTKIEQSFLKLMEMCSFKTTADYNAEYEANSFYLRLQNSKWLKRVSSVLTLTSKIVNCLIFQQKNVFLEEYKSNMDCSCILTSLTKICIEPRYRTITGLENIIKKDWFLTGHMFNTRLHSYNLTTNDEVYFVGDKKRGSNSSNSSEITITDTTPQSPKQFNKSNTQISPIFLLFLDCLHQLITQYPDEFEFNEIYLIHLWDYACSCISLIFSFDGLTNWLNFLNTETFTNSQLTSPVAGLPVDPNSASNFEPKFLIDLFDANENFWLTHLEEEAGSDKESDKANANKEANSFQYKNLFLNKEFKKQNRNKEKEMVLIPNDKIYVLKFWSKCYLRWNEQFFNNENYRKSKFDVKNENKSQQQESLSEEINTVVPQQHVRQAPLPPTQTTAPNFKFRSKQQDEDNQSFINTQEQPINQHVRAAPQPPQQQQQQQQPQQTPPLPPPPITPKPKLKASEDVLDKTQTNTSPKPKITHNNTGLKITTRVMSDGNIESSF